jgi:hypothetical protein
MAIRRPPRPAEPRHSTINDNCTCYPCQVTTVVVEYMMWKMEPTDRALWPVPAPRVEMTEPPPGGAPGDGGSGISG